MKIVQTVFAVVYVAGSLVELEGLLMKIHDN